VTVVYFDSETPSLKPDSGFIQLAAVAVATDWTELETFEVKIKFDEAQADPQALKMNHYEPFVWARDAISEATALQDFASFLNRHRSIEMISKRTGKPYSVARLAGHNAATFDGPRLFDAFRRYDMFCPAHPQVLCTLQLCAWWCIAKGKSLPSLKLTEVAKYFEISPVEAHDALIDVRLAISVSRRIIQELNDANPTTDW
jgi:DNA polymerase III epsilon subunit-like protein